MKSYPQRILELSFDRLFRQYKQRRRRYSYYLRRLLPQPATTMKEILWQTEAKSISGTHLLCA